MNINQSRNQIISLCINNHILFFHYRNVHIAYKTPLVLVFFCSNLIIMNDPQNLYCRAWQYLFEIVTVAKNDCILTDSDRGRCQRTFLRPKRHADPECNDHCRNRYTDPADRCSQRCYRNRIFPALCRSIFLRWRKQLSVLFGLIVGYIVAIAMGVVDFSALQGTSIIALPRLMPYSADVH